MSDRRLYDLCRKYKYFYRKYTSLKKVNDEFYDKDVRNAYVKAQDELDDIRDDIITVLLSPYLRGVEINCDVPTDGGWFNSEFVRNPFVNCSQKYSTTIDGKKFADLINMVLINSRRFYIR